MKVFAIAMMPVGVIGVLGNGGSGLTSSEAASIRSGDENVRNESARTTRSLGPGGSRIGP